MSFNYFDLLRAADPIGYDLARATEKNLREQFHRQHNVGRNSAEPPATSVTKTRTITRSVSRQLSALKAEVGEVEFERQKAELEMVQKVDMAINKAMGR